MHAQFKYSDIFNLGYFVLFIVVKECLHLYTSMFSQRKLLAYHTYYDSMCVRSSGYLWYSSIGFDVTRVNHYQWYAVKHTVIGIYTVAIITDHLIFLVILAPIHLNT